MQHVHSPGRPSQNQGRESQGEDRSVFQSWRKYSTSIADIKLLVVPYNVTHLSLRTILSTSFHRLP